MDELFSLLPNEQATAQILAILVTLAFAVVGGLITGNLDFFQISGDYFNIINVLVTTLAL